jgi:MFS family permease
MAIVHAAPGTARDLQAAVALGGVSMNVARAIGPALGGLMIATQGPGPVFLVNAASFVVVIVVLAFVPKPEMTSSLPPERVIGAMGAGVRFLRTRAARHRGRGARPPSWCRAVRSGRCCLSSPSTTWT